MTDRVEADQADSADENPVPLLIFFLLLSTTIALGVVCSEIGTIKIGPGQSRPLELVGTPGETINVRLFEGESPGAVWSSSDGFYMRVGDPGTGFETVVPVLPPTKISEESDHDRFTASGSFVVPEVPGGETQVLFGTSQGDVMFPIESSDSGSTDQKLVSIEVPVHLKVVPPGYADTSAKQIFRKQMLAVTVYLVFWVALISIIIYCYLKGKKESEKGVNR